MEVTINEKALDKRSSIIIGLVALIQGIGLYWYEDSLGSKTWPGNDWTWTLILGSFFFIVPTLVTLSYRSDYPQKNTGLASLA